MTIFEGNVNSTETTTNYRLHSGHFKWRNPTYNFKWSLMSPLNVERLGWCGQDVDSAIMRIIYHIPRKSHYNNYSEFSLDKVIPQPSGSPHLH